MASSGAAALQTMGHIESSRRLEMRSVAVPQQHRARCAAVDCGCGCGVTRSPGINSCEQVVPQDAVGPRDALQIFTLILMATNSSAKNIFHDMLR